MSPLSSLCVIIPTYNAADGLRDRLTELLSVSRVVVADGGSCDDTLATAIGTGAVIAAGASGRGQQLALGARHTGDSAAWLLFLHADNALPDNWRDAVTKHMTKHANCVGYFRYRADATGFWPRFMDFWVGMRCQWWGLPYGDQGLLISRDMYDALGGYADISLFEDVDIVDRIKAKFGRDSLRPLRGHMLINVSKYDQDGIWSRGRKNIALLRAYRRGASIKSLSETYRV